MESKDYLRQVIDHTVNGDTEAANAAFKQFIVPKTIEVLGIKKNTTPEEITTPDESVTDIPVTDKK
jgi:hypothetical protein